MPEQLTIEQFGATIKQKYPQYQGLSDAEIGAKTLARYPEYSSRVVGATPQETGAVSDIKGIGTGIKEAGQRRSEKVAEIGEARKSGEQGLVRSTLQTLGQGAGFASDIIGETVVGGIKALTPQPVQEKAGELIEAGAEKVIESPAAQDIIERINNLDEKSKRDLSAVLGVTGLAAEFVGGSALKQPLKQVGQKTADIAGDVAAKTAKTSFQSAEKLKDLTKGARIKIGDQILPIDDTVRTTLKRTDPEVFAKHIDQAKKATLDQKEMTPLELAGTKAEEALQSVQGRLKSVGQQKAEIMNRAKVGNKTMGTEALKARQNILKEIGDTTLDGTDQRIVNDMLDRLTILGRNPQLKDVDEFIDYAQEQLFKSQKNLTINVGGNVERILKNEIKRLNESVKSNAPKAYRNLNARYADQINLRDKLNKALGSEANKGGSLMKRVFSPTDSGTKKLFADVKKATGIDLTDEAVLAKFAMELYGDARQASLLQQLSIPTKTGVIDKILKTAGGAAGLDDFLRNLRIKKAQKLSPTKQTPAKQSLKAKGAIPETKVEDLMKTQGEQIPVDKIFKNSKGGNSKQLTNLDDLADETIGFENLPTKVIGVDDIIPTQSMITKKNLKEVIGLDDAKLPKEDRIRVYEIDGKFYLRDGHHRVASKILNGDKTIEVSVFTN